MGRERGRQELCEGETKGTLAKGLPQLGEETLTCHPQFKGEFKYHLARNSDAEVDLQMNSKLAGMVKTPRAAGIPLGTVLAFLWMAVLPSAPCPLSCTVAETPQAEGPARRAPGRTRLTVLAWVKLLFSLTDYPVKRLVCRRAGGGGTPGPGTRVPVLGNADKLMRMPRSPGSKECHTRVCAPHSGASDVCRRISLPRVREPCWGHTPRRVSKNSG